MDGSGVPDRPAASWMAYGCSEHFKFRKERFAGLRRKGEAKLRLRNTREKGVKPKT